MKPRIRDHASKHTPEYKRHMASAKWRELRERFIDFAGHMCMRCLVEEDSPFAKGPLEIHHRTYDRLGKEHYDDLECLCRSCHEIADEERVDEARAKAATSAYNTGLNTWATNKYGENWEAYHFEEAHEGFDHFISWKRNQW